MTVTSDNSAIIPNRYPITGPCTGVLYSITALGGYNIHQSFPTITLATVNPINKYDLTNALQVQLSVSTFNAKLGSYNALINRFPNDTITLNAAEFIAGMNASRVISLGTYSTLYSDFINYVNSYFSYAGGFTSLFASINSFDFNNGIFDANAFIALINETPVNGVPQVTGTITIYNVNNLLQYAVDANVFGNRANIAGNTISTGFLDGDLILVPAGTTITLDLQIDLGSSNIPSSGLHQVSSSTIKYGDYRYSVSTVAAMNNINRVLTAPLLIKLKNI
jgi:hypothetical protein